MHRIKIKNSVKIPEIIEWLAGQSYYWDFEVPLSLKDNSYIFLFDDPNVASHFALKWKQ